MLFLFSLFTKFSIARERNHAFVVLFLVLLPQPLPLLWLLLLLPWIAWLFAWLASFSMFWCLNFIPFHFYTIADTSNGCVQRYVSITSCLFHFENIFLLLLLRLLLLFNVRWNELRIHLTATVVVVVVLVVVFVIFIKLALFMCSRHKSSVCVLTSHFHRILLVILRLFVLHSILSRVWPFFY